MYESDKKIFELFEILKKIGKAKSDNEVCVNIGFLRQNILRVRNGKAHFTAQHIENICKVYEVNANWIINISKKVFNSNELNNLLAEKNTQKSAQTV